MSGGRVTYLIVNIKFNGSFSGSIIGFLKWIYGCGSWLYFVPVLFWCKVLCVWKNFAAQSILSSLSLLSIVFTSMSVIPYNDYFTPYTNPFNFLIYFQMDMLYRRLHVRILGCKYTVFSLIAMLLLYMMTIGLHSYFNLFCVPIAISAFVLFYNLSSIINHGEIVGKTSYVIYLCHLIPVSIFNRHGMEFFGGWFDYFKVPIAFFMITVFVCFGYFLVAKLELNKLSKILGYR